MSRACALTTTTILLAAPGSAMVYWGPHACWLTRGKCPGQVSCPHPVFPSLPPLQFSETDTEQTQGARQSARCGLAGSCMYWGRQPARAPLGSGDRGRQLLWHLHPGVPVQCRRTIRTACSLNVVREEAVGPREAENWGWVWQHLA